MILLVLSDTHRRTDRMITAAEIIKPDAVLHLGDYTEDIVELQSHLPDIDCYAVPGNGDYDFDIDSETLLSFHGFKIFMTHGHKFGVKSGLDRLIRRAEAVGADLALFGHTHQALSRKYDGIWLFNPGQMSRHDERLAASYGVVTIDEKGFTCDIRMLPVNPSFSGGGMRYR